MHSFPDSYEWKKICIFGPIMQRTHGKRVSKKYAISPLFLSILAIIILEEKKYE
jgi:hypothetical protein